MSSGIFEDVGSLPIVGIYDISFVYDTHMGIYTNWRLEDIPKLSAIANKGVKSWVYKE